ncbi:MAG: hypothetical protein IPL79_16725 [Myxococcales bacterium]|nr:hypothetical protein [Myxococcales bacterium]
MSRQCAIAMLLAAAAALTACQGRSRPWPKSAGTTPYRDEDLGQSLAPAQPPMSAVESGKGAPAPTSPTATPTAAPATLTVPSPDASAEPATDSAPEEVIIIED